MNKNDILDYVTETPSNTNRAVLGSMLDSFSGSGGSSDFSTATVTYVDEQGNGIKGPFLVEFPGVGETINVGLWDSGTYDIVLYKGLAICEAAEQSIASVSGDAELWGEYFVKVYGDCTITIS